MKNKRLIVVLGMHRSGSSAITKGLETLGVNLGSHLMAADANNVKGYFEDIEFNQLNSKILRVNGHDWNTLSLIDNIDFQDDKFNPLKDQAFGLLKAKLENTNMLGIKDPRFCRLLPFWKDVFDELQLDVSYVIILRDPESIASSLYSRDSFPRVKTLYLWLEYMIPVFRETRGCARSVVGYEQLVADPKAVIERLADDLDLRAHLDPQAQHFFETEFIDAALRHHQRKPGSEAGFTPRPVRQLDELLGQVSRQNISIDSSAFAREINLIEEECRDRRDILAYIDTLDSIVINKHLKLAEQSQHLDTLSTKCSKVAEDLSSSENMAASLKMQIDELNTAIVERDEQRASLQILLTARDSSIASLQHSLTECEAQIGKLTQELKSLEQQNASNVAYAENLARQLDDIHSSLFWRSSIISRKFWQFIEFIFRRKR